MFTHEQTPFVAHIQVTVPRATDLSCNPMHTYLKVSPIELSGTCVCRNLYNIGLHVILGYSVKNQLTVSVLFYSLVGGSYPPVL